MGFEPTIQNYLYNGLANRRLKPLGHPSSVYNWISNLYWILRRLLQRSSSLRFLRSQGFSNARFNFRVLNIPSLCIFLFNTLNAKSTSLSFTSTCNNFLPAFILLNLPFFNAYCNSSQEKIFINLCFCNSQDINDNILTIFS